jgi:hypothetical protein
MLALTVPIFGAVALYAYLADGAQRTLALGAMASSIVGISMTLSRLGVFAYAVPALGRSFLDGNQESIRILGRIFAGPLGVVEIASILHYSASFVLFAIAIWRSGVLPGWAGVLMADNGSLISGPFPGVGSVVGALLAFVGGGWIALGALRGTPASRSGSRPDASCLVMSRDVRTLRAQGSLPLGSNFRWMRILPILPYHC